MRMKCLAEHPPEEEEEKCDDDSEDDTEIMEVDKPRLPPKEALQMLDKIVGMGELEEEDITHINGIIQKNERLVIRRKKQRSIQDYFLPKSW